MLSRLVVPNAESVDLGHRSEGVLLLWKVMGGSSCLWSLAYGLPLCLVLGLKARSGQLFLGESTAP
jgi:hypothetical protein